MELDHLHVHQGRASAVGQGHAVAGDGYGVCAGLVETAQPARAEDYRLGANGEDAAGAYLHGSDATALAILHYQ